MPSANDGIYQAEESFVILRVYFINQYHKI